MGDFNADVRKFLIWTKLITSVKISQDKNYCLCKVHYEELVLNCEKKSKFTVSVSGY